MTQAAGTDITGPFRSPRNLSRDAGEGSIHDDATASRLGFRSGAVGGSIHMDQFVPVLVSAFGEEWLERGNLSLYFLQPTVDREPVRCLLSRAADEVQARVSMENEKGDPIAVGTASCGEPDTETEVRRRMARQRPSESLRILAGANPGDEISDIPWRVRAPGERVLSEITEPLPAYEGRGRWDGAVVPLSHTVHSIAPLQQKLTPESGPPTLYGALEVQYHDGPLIADREVRARARVLMLTESPKTENLWWQCTYSEAESGRDIVSVLQYLRFMKAASPLWSEGRA